MAEYHVEQIADILMVRPGRITAFKADELRHTMPGPHPSEYHIHMRAPDENLREPSLDEDDRSLRQARRELIFAGFSNDKISRLFHEAGLAFDGANLDVMDACCTQGAVKYQLRTDHSAFLGKTFHAVAGEGRKIVLPSPQEFESKVYRHLLKGLRRLQTEEPLNFMTNSAFPSPK